MIHLVTVCIATNSSFLYIYIYIKFCSKIKNKEKLKSLRGCCECCGFNDWSKINKT